MHSGPVKVAPTPLPSTTPSWRWSRPSSAAVSRSTTSSALSPWRRSARPSGPERGLAYDCVAIAPTWGSAHGTTEPTARYFDCVATPHWPASRSHATIEYVATTGLAIRELGQVEVEQLRLRGRHDHASDLRPRERALDVFGRARPHGDGPAGLVSLLQRRLAGDVV